MSKHHALSLPTAILININVMLGIGVFMNTVVLAKRASALGAFMYILIGLMMLPLILSMAHLVRLHPEGVFMPMHAKKLTFLLGFWAPGLFHRKIRFRRNCAPHCSVTYSKPYSGTVFHSYTCTGCNYHYVLCHAQHAQHASWRQNSARFYCLKIYTNRVCNFSRHCAVPTRNT